MSEPHGRRLRLSIPRRLVCDLMQTCRGLPLIPMERRMRLAPLVEARERLSERPSWCAIFTKAYAIVAARRPELRRAYFGLPWPHLYEHPRNVAAVAIERFFDGEPGILFGPLIQPEQQPLVELDEQLRYLKTTPLREVGLFRRAVRLAAWPWPVRRLCLWLGLHLTGRQRVKQSGTFGVSVVAGQGGGQLALISPLTTTLYYAPFEPDGSLELRIVFDHRVLDGAFLARVLAELEQVLLNEILSELRQLHRQAA